MRKFIIQQYLGYEMASKRKSVVHGKDDNTGNNAKDVELR